MPDVMSSPPSDHHDRGQPNSTRAVTFLKTRHCEIQTNSFGTRPVPKWVTRTFQRDLNVCLDRLNNPHLFAAIAHSGRSFNRPFKPGHEITTNDNGRCCSKARTLERQCLNRSLHTYCERHRPALVDRFQER